MYVCVCMYVPAQHTPTHYTNTGADTEMKRRRRKKSNTLYTICSLCTTLTLETDYFQWKTATAQSVWRLMNNHVSCRQQAIFQLHAERINAFLFIFTLYFVFISNQSVCFLVLFFSLSLSMEKFHSHFPIWF